MKPVSSKARYGLLLSSTSGRKTFRCVGCIVASAQLFTVGFVVAILLGVMTVGFFGLLPNVYHNPTSLFWNQMITIFLSINISVNYAMAALKRSTSVDTKLPHVEGNFVPEGFYDNYRYCVPCQGVKSPGAHHCRTCNACIDDMDHHCPFIANCVGRRNMHNFLLFLFWTGVGAMYAMLTCILVIINAWPLIMHRPRHHRNASILSFSLSAGMHGLASRFTLAACYMFIVCFTGSIGVFILLVSQLQQIQRGQSYIETLKSKKAAARHENIYVSLTRVFGGRNPFVWLFPFCFARNRTYESVDSKTR